jgi:aspartyl protease family protein
MLPDWGTHAHAYLVIGAVVLALVVARRIPVLRTIVAVMSWVVAIVLIAAIIGERGNVDPTFARIAAFLKLDDQQVTGKEVRIRLSPDGHFWARVRIGDVERRMLVDSGATVTALSVRTAAAAGLDPQAGLIPVLLTTANGTVRAQDAEVPELKLGNIVARNLHVVVSPAFGDVNVLGMNFLSKLRSWRVEDGTLILVPHHPQPTTAEGK